MDNVMFPELMLHTSKRLERVRRNCPQAYVESNDIEKVLREAAAVENVQERFAQVGAAGLSTVDLITILIGEQTPTTASRIISQFQTLSRIHHANIGQLAAVEGMTKRKAMLLQCALELTNRNVTPSSIPIIKTPQDVANLIGPRLRGLCNEEMWVLSLNTKNHVISTDVVYRGSVHTTVIRIGELFRSALYNNASGIVVAHNHPSSDPSPSPEDVAVTRQIVQAGKLLDIDLLDHIVIGDPNFVSLKDRGLGFS
jgi:DNA repair protein RadC